jgi:hypothetical protein
LWKQLRRKRKDVVLQLSIEREVQFDLLSALPLPVAGGIGDGEFHQKNIWQKGKRE